MSAVEDLSRLTLAEKRELALKLLRRRAGAAGERFPLASGQRSLWFLYRLAPTSPAYHFAYAARVRSAVDTDALRRACAALVARHPVLRTTFAQADGEAVQTVHECFEVAVGSLDASGWTEEELLKKLRAEADRPFDLENGPAFRVALLRRGERDYVLSLVVHHIVADLWSMDLLIRELRVLYAAEERGADAGLPPVPSRYADFVRRQSVLSAGPAGERAWAFWQPRLSGELPVLDLPTDRPRPPVQTYRGASHTEEINPATVRRVRDLARREKATLFTTLLAVFQVLLHRYTGQDDLIVGTTTAGRTRLEWEGVVGYFLNQLPLRVDLSDRPSFGDLLGRVSRQVYEAMEHQDYPFSQLVERLQPPRDPGRPPVFQAMFIWDKPRELDAGDHAGSGLRLEPVLMEQRGAPLDLTLIVFEEGERLTATLRYNTDLFDALTIRRMAGHFRTLLDAAAADPCQKISELPLLTSEELQTVLHDWNQTATPLDRPACFHRFFEERARSHPNAPALVFSGQQISYGELNARANRLARFLRRVGVGPGRLAGLCVPRSPEMIVAVLAVWKAGAAYVPLDPLLPRKRIEFILEDARPAVLLTRSDVAASLPELTAEVIRLDQDAGRWAEEAADDLAETPAPDDLAYVIYTSGSTGRPKGTLLGHRGLRNLFEAQGQVFDLGPGRRVLQFASLSFDASVYEIAMSLGTGAALVLAPQAALLPGPAFVAFLREQAVTTLTLPPSILAALPHEELPALETLVVAGEPCPAELVARWAPGRKFFNAYGPTEATVWSTVSRCLPDGKKPTIGRPVANTRTYVLDRDLQPVPIGVPGELHLAGPGLALGYLNQPELTAARFIANPFSNEPGDRLYKTGDLVRYRPDGEIEFLGRLDHQLKVRGYRIEPGEVESLLRQHSGVRDAVVTVQAGATCAAGGLVAYVVPERTVAVADLHAYLRERLPHYMLPGAIQVMDEFPRTRSDKVDRQALPRVTRTAVTPVPCRTEARSPTEEALARVWAAVLQVPAVGIHENFFDLGGASIQTLQVVELAQRERLSLTPEMIFQYQTVAELAAHCGTEDRPTPGEKNGHAAAVPAAKPARHRGTVAFGLMFFGGTEDESAPDKYRLLIESARFADEHGFAAVWLPERHFTRFGCLYPSPAVLHAALARETRRLRLRAGSVVLPLHHPIRVAEEWAVVDNLSGGRVEISFAPGWSPVDFALSPEKYADRHAAMYAAMETFHRLWAGEAVEATGGNGAAVRVRVYPTPVQRRIPTWVTVAGNPKSFAKAGEAGADLLTHLFHQTVAELEANIRLYRESRTRCGLDPESGRVAVALHTFLAGSMAEVRRHAQKPYCEYLLANAGHLESLAASRGLALNAADLSGDQLAESVHYLFEKFCQGRSLLGTPEGCLPLVEELASVGVDEVACLVDFGPPAGAVLESLCYLDKLKEQCKQTDVRGPTPG